MICTGTSKCILVFQWFALFLNGNFYEESFLISVADVTLYDIVAELVKLNTYPAPQNPFELDTDYFSSLPPAERVLETAAMIQTLKSIFLNTSNDRPYTGYGAIANFCFICRHLFHVKPV